VLRSKIASDIADTNRAVVSVKADEHVNHVVKKLAEANIHCVPVSEDGNCLGMLDLSDVVSYMVHLFAKKAGVAEDATPDVMLAELEKKTFHKIDLEEGRGMSYRFAHVTAKELINFSKQNAFNPVPGNTNLLDLMKILQTSRRVPIVDDKGHITSLVSQSRVVNYVADHLTDVTIHGKTLQDLNLSHKHVITVPATSRALDAFARLHAYKISAVAITDASGKFVGNLSFKDVKAAVDDLKHLLMPVFDFVAGIRREVITSTVSPTIHCHPTDTLAAVVMKLKVVKIHRLYVEDLNQKLTGVVSVGDIVRILLQHTK